MNGRSIPIARGPAAAVSCGTSWAPEDNPFQSIFIDVTHRCNMECRNCYAPNREVADLDPDWILGILARLPRRTRIRLIGGEPTLYAELPRLIRGIRQAGHLPIILSNGLLLARRDTVRTLKAAGLRTVYLSMNGGLRDDLYQAIDDRACAQLKLTALDHLCAENFYVSVGMIVVRGINDGHVADFRASLRSRPNVRELHLRSVGRIGRHLATEPLTLPELATIAGRMTGRSPDSLLALRRASSNYIDFDDHGLEIQLTQWPDLGNPYRGRLLPSGRIEAFMENIVASDGAY